MAVLLTMLALAAPAAANDRADCSKPLEGRYSAHYYAVRQQVNRRAPGRNIRRHGVRYRTRHGYKVRDARCHELKRSLRQLRALQAPAPALTRRVAVRPRQRPAGTLTAGVRATLPDCTWRPESGGNYGAYNPSSGAYGKYQVIPSTWAAHCSDLGRGPDGQERCAARVWQAQGAGAWVGC